MYRCKHPDLVPLPDPVLDPDAVPDPVPDAAASHCNIEETP